MASQRVIAHKVCAVAGAALALAAFATSVQACSGPAHHLTVLLGAVPPVAENSEVIARVEIVEVHTRQPPGTWAVRVARARVLKSIRGVTDGQIVEIYASGTSCGGELGRDDVGRQGFVAGRFFQSAAGTLFGGGWSRAQVGFSFTGLEAPETRPWWRMPWSYYRSPWYFRAALMALVVVLLWYVAGWLDRRKSKTG